MKKFLMALCFMISFSSVVMAGVSVELNGEKINFTDENGFTVNPQIINSRTMVPLRKIFETLGAKIEWYGDTETVIAKKGDTTVKLQINNPIAEVTKDGITSKITLEDFFTLAKIFSTCFFTYSKEAIGPLVFDAVVLAKYGCITI